MEVIHVSAECFPVAKVGGLADVVGALPKYLNAKKGIHKVVMPFYQKPFIEENEWMVDYENKVQCGADEYQVKILKEKKNQLGFDLYVVWIDYLFNRENVYGYQDDPYRFLAFQIAVLDWINQWEHTPDIIHCHDHQAGLIPFMMKYTFKYQKLTHIPSVFTIHNAQYQGWMSWDMLQYFPWFHQEYDQKYLEWNHEINSLASAIKCAWKVTTVSPHYMWELSQNANGLESLIQDEYEKCSGILNGIDEEVWNPEIDQDLIKNYSNKTFKKGKEENKKWLCERFNFDMEKPLIAFIGRFAIEKGADILAETILNSLNKAKQDVNYLVLGSGAKYIEDSLESIIVQSDGKMNLYVGYNESLSRKVYAGADFMLIPSKIEPCGLNQMYSTRYGTIPIVHTVGGLYDTIVDYDDDNGFGIRFIHNDIHDIAHAISRAEYVYNNPKKKDEIQKRMMKIDFSWNKSALEYLNLYENLIS
ncbi:starch synthase [Flavobacteriaceae bacterium UJ101]|nr:starch synthase [Flavobacteriaceae bacterium UJ101]